MQVLLAHESLDMDQQTEDGTTALMVAARGGDDPDLNAITEMLLRHTKPPHQSINAADNEGTLSWRRAKPSAAKCVLTRHNRDKHDVRACRLRALTVLCVGFAWRVSGGTLRSKCRHITPG